MAQHQANCLRNWAQPARVVRTGPPAGRMPSVRGSAGDAATFIGAMHNISAPAPTVSSGPCARCGSTTCPIMDDSRTRPVAGALFAVNLRVATPGGGTFTFEELRADLAAAGFAQARVRRRDVAMNCIVVARKTFSEIAARSRWTDA